MEKVTQYGCIMILGAPNDKDGNLSAIAKSRLKQGAKELGLHPDFKILLIGGFGKHFNETNYPHWTYAKDFLIKELFVSPESILPEAIESSNTVEDFEKAMPLFQKYKFPKIIIVTSEFHLKRVQYIAEKALESTADTLSYS
ncbi:MAG: YdcF family protein, partial [Bacteroidota bacterium]|nr:YdcF family protein [Bacteroidota bacterium]